MLDPFVAHVGRALARLAPPAPFLVAVSGGADSLALLHALARHPDRTAPLFAATIDHALRPDSADVARAVVRFSESIGVPCTLHRVDVDPTDGGLEEAARNARYAALHAAATQVRAGSLVLGHTATDQAETLLWRLVRGTGPRGLAGMREVRPWSEAGDGPLLVRPMLELTREETRAYAVRAGLPFHDDPTNVDDRPRARLRREVLPILDELQAGATTRIAAAGSRLAREDAFLDAQAAATVSTVERPSIEGLRALPDVLLARSLFAWVAGRTGSRRRLGQAHVEALVRLVKSGRGEVELPATRELRHVARVENGALVLETRTRGGPANGEEA